MQVNIKALILCSILLIVGSLLSGAYLSMQPVHLSQPDDTKLSLFASGDEYYNWLHDKDGYTVKQNNKGWYVYLVNNANKELIFTDYIVGKAEPTQLDLVPWANITPEKMGQIRQKSQLQLKEIGSGRAPSSGTLNNVSIFIRFSDQTEFGQDVSTYSSMFNGTTGNTMQSYFKEASYNALNITTSFYPSSTTTVVSWQDSHPRAYYSPYNATTNPTGYDGDAQRTDREFTLLANAVNGVTIPTTPSIDADNDGMVDNVCFIIKGGSDGWAELLWPHRWSIYDRYVYINGKRVYDFNFQLSDFLASSGPGVLCHEMFHSLGAPDLYHYSSDGNSPVGAWDIMEQNANPPQHMGAYMKYKYGHWISSIPALSTTGTYTLNPLTSSTGQCYRINSPNSTAEYFVVEFRKQTGTFESSLPNSGILIYRINPALDGNADGPPDEVYLFRPGGSSTANGTVSSANFSTEAGRTSINNTTNPYAFLSNGTLGGISLSSISSSAGSTMSFYYNLSNAPLNLTAESAGGTVSLTWQAPQTGTPSSYKIYRNNAYIGASTGLNYTDSAVTVGQAYTYYVTAMLTNPVIESAATNTVNITVSNQSVVIIGNGSSTQNYPLDRYYNYSAHESIYLASEIGIVGAIKTIAYYKTSGDDVASIAPVTIYMKNTSATTLATGTYSTTGYTQVYSGAFPNTSTVGWMGVNLSTQFLYDGISNLSILIVSGYQAYTASRPYWTYSTSATNRARQNHNDTVAPTSLTVTTALPNMRLNILPTTGLLLPPQSLAANATHGSVSLTWTAPVSGSPTGYKIYKNSALLTTVNAFSYTDAAVSDGITYSYYLLAVYSSGNSAATNTVTATPNVIAPTNLTATPGNGVINLNWTAPTGRGAEEALGTKDTRNISGYKIFRNGVALTTVSGTTYQDTGLTNGTSYSYYVSTVYTNPAGESTASNVVSAIPAVLTEVIIGAGTGVTGTYDASPINVFYKSLHGQAVYTAAELNASGIMGPINISQIGFNITGLPQVAMPNFVIRMKHTTSANVASWIDAAGMTTVYFNASYLPTALGYNMYTLNTPFLWNGTDNIVIDTAFGVYIPAYSATGQIQYTTVTNGYRCGKSDTIDQTNLFTAGAIATTRPNVKFIFAALTHLDPPIITSIEKTQAGIQVQWLPVSNANYYRVYRSFDPYGDYSDFRGSTSQTVFVDTESDTHPRVFYIVIGTDLE